MKKLQNTLLFALCAPFFFVSCAKENPQNDNLALQTPPTQTTPTPDLPPIQQPQIPQIPQTQNAEFWDTSRFDTSLINKDKKLIAFSFDDAPGKTLENILAVFADFNENNPDCIATATVFCNGRLISESSARTLSMATLLGWELGNHTYSHCDLALLPDNRLPEEIVSVEEQLTAIDNAPHHLFRAPYGKVTEEAKAFVKVPVCNWTIDTLDWTGISAEEIYNTVMTQAYAGAIVLLHDGYLETVRALKRLLPDLKNNGYQVTGISQMSKAHNCPLKNGNEYIRCRPKS